MALLENQVAVVTGAAIPLLASDLSGHVTRAAVEVAGGRHL
ncbi:MAG: hypothetical protein QOC62_1304 [Mycobacterium sp.]|jgi:hypothetical protein|nr:hypothetical protein [Mycobacterium sp.]